MKILITLRNGLKRLTSKNFSKLSFFILGIGSTIWFLIRVIPKPSRANYPCIKASMPIASSFVLYILGITSTMFIFKKARKFLLEAKYILFAATMIIAIGISLFTSFQTSKKAMATYTSITFTGANDPIGVGQGLFPGRIAWVHDVDATNEDCSNSTNDYWFDDDNTNQEVVSNMLSDGLKLYTEEETDEAAWDAIFKFFNSNHDKGEVGYTAGEKIVIKTNMNAYWNGDDGINTAPQLSYALLDHLINIVGVAESDICIGDPNCNMMEAAYETCHNEFPGVTYFNNSDGGGNVTAHENVIFWSDGTDATPLPQSYIDADYLINVPVLKKHHRAGITLTAKNHFGSFAPFTDGAWFVHHSLPCPDATGISENGEYGTYRCLVDIIGHKELGGKTLLYLIDAIWGSTNWGHPPVKYRMTPFNNDWPNSIFVSLDPVATESFAYDILFNEFDEDHPTEGGTPDSDKGPFPHFEGTDDYIIQAADPANWPSGFEYDPEGDGVPISGSLGVHEHWNNVTEKKYSRNLGMDEGIELLVQSNGTTSIYEEENPFSLQQNYPNPFSTNTTISYELMVSSIVNITIYDINGKMIKNLVNIQQDAGIYNQTWDGTLSNGAAAPSGTYLYTIEASHNNKLYNNTKTLVLKR